MPPLGVVSKSTMLAARDASGWINRMPIRIAILDLSDFWKCFTFPPLKGSQGLSPMGGGSIEIHPAKEIKRNLEFVINLSRLPAERSHLLHVPTGRIPLRRRGAAY